MQNVLQKYKIALVLGLLLLLGIAPFFKPGFIPTHDDSQMIRLVEMEKCFRDGQIPCRWTPDMGGGYGHPLFNYYPVFPYYLGMFFRLSGVSLIFTYKLLLSLAFIVSGLGLYLLARQFYNQWAALGGTVLFYFAPYHAVQSYVRGALTESWGLAFFPLIFLCSYRLTKEGGKKWLVATALSLSGLLLSHHIMSMVFFPFIVFWLSYWVFVKRNTKHLTSLVISLLLAFGLSAFFLFPAFLERPLVQLEAITGGYYDYGNHFPTIFQLFFDRHWGYGPSVPGLGDGLSFQIGWPHWWLIIILFALIAIRPRYATNVSLLFFFGLSFSLLLFFIHGRSYLFWQAIPPLAYVQFPWRLLAPLIFFVGLLGACFIDIFKKKSVYVSLTIIGLTLILNLPYFKPREYLPDLTDQSFQTFPIWPIQQLSILDYLPKTATRPTQIAFDTPYSEASGVLVSEYQKRSDFWRFTVINTLAQSQSVIMPIVDFPRWLVLIDQKPTIFSRNQDGLIIIPIPRGSHTVTGWFTNTPIRSLSNLITAVSFLILLFIILIEKKSPHHNQ